MDPRSRSPVGLIPKLLRDLEPGTRIVSHAVDMGGWQLPQ
jgi:hypothetical protein